MTVGRISQAAAEVLLQAAPRARLGQQSAELLLQTTPRARLGQQSVEVLRSTALAAGGVARPPILILCLGG